MGTIAERHPLQSGLLALAGLLVALACVLALREETPVGSFPLGGSPQASIAEAPLAFEPSAGRFGGRVAFVSSSVAGGSLYLRPKGALLQVPQNRHGSGILRLDFLGSTSSSAPIGLKELPGRANSFIGDDPSRWRSGIPTFGAVRYRSLYPGIDLDFHGNQRALEYDFRLASHADPSLIEVGLKGAHSLRLSPGGDLLIGLGSNTVRQHAPVAYQWVGGERRAVAAAFEMRGSTLGFRLGAYDRGRPLVIDPILTYSTYLGGSKDEFGFDIATDSSGAVYVSGQTNSLDFPLEDQAFVDQALTNAFITKFNPAADGERMTLAYSTYLGASKDDSGGSIAVDGKGAAYVSGTTASENFPTVDPLAGPAGGDLPSFDAYVTKFSPDSGGAVTIDYSTYISGSVTEFSSGVAVDSQGAAYIVGNTDSTDYPVQDQFQGNQKDGDAFLTKLNPDSGGPVTLAYSTYFGGSANQDRLSGITVDSKGAAYISGYTDSTDFPTQHPLEGDKGGFDVLAMKVNPDSGGPVTLAYSTYLGGSAGEFAGDIAVDPAGAAYIVGSTDSTDFPEIFPFESNQGSEDAFVTKIRPDNGGTVSLAYSTYLGAALDDTASSVDVTSDGNAVVVGSTLSEEFPLSLDPLYGDQAARDGFVTEFEQSPGRNVEVPFSTYIGGNGVDEANSVVVGPRHASYIVGSTDSTDFPLRSEFQDKLKGPHDTWVAKLDDPPPTTGPGSTGTNSTGTPIRDVTAPETTITRRPRPKISTRHRRARVAFGFTSSEPGSHFECSLGNAAFAPCSSPASYRLKVKAKPRKYGFRVRAIDAAGNVDGTPAAARLKAGRRVASATASR